LDDFEQLLFWNFVPNSTDFEQKLRFFFKFEFPGDWIHWEFVFTSINSPVHKLGQQVLRDGLQTLFFDLDDMHRPSPKIKEVMEFLKELSAKQSLEIFQVRET
jgi:hypothetical protein